MTTIFKKIMFRLGWNLHKSEIEYASELLVYLVIIITATASFLELYHAGYHLRHDRRPFKALLHFILSCSLATFSYTLVVVLS